MMTIPAICTENPATENLAPGPGYRLLQKGEQINPGDEFQSDAISLGSWYPSGCAGEIYGSGCKDISSTVHWPHRRALPFNKIEPGEGYRLLGSKEILMDGDEFYVQQDNTWAETEEMGNVVGVYTLTYRRKSGNFPSYNLTPLNIESKPGELAEVREELAFVRENAAAWEKNCKDAYAAQERADKEVASLTVDLLDRNRLNLQLGQLLHRKRCGCVYKDCAEHGAYAPEDCELYERVLAAPYSGIVPGAKP